MYLSTNRANLNTDSGLLMHDSCNHTKLPKTALNLKSKTGVFQSYLPQL